MMPLQIQETPDKIIVHFTDSRILDEEKIQEIGAQLEALLGQYSQRRMLLNFTNVMFMSSAMLGKIILFNKTCKSSNVELRLCGIAPGIMDVFKVLKLNKVFRILKNCDDDDRPEFHGSPVPNPFKPRRDSWHAKPPDD